MQRVYTAAILYFCFVLETAVLATTSVGYTQIVTPGEVSNLSLLHRRTPVFSYVSESSIAGNFGVRRKKRLSEVQNIHRKTFLSVPARSVGQLVSQRHKRELVKLIYSILRNGRGQTSHDSKRLISRSVPHDVRRRPVFKKIDNKSVKYSKRKSNYLQKRNYKITHMDSKVWQRTWFWKTFHGDNHRHLVKRDSSLITEYCGPLGHRCRTVPQDRCVNICVDGRRQTLCKVRNSVTRQYVCVLF